MPIGLKSGKLSLLEPSGPVQGCTRIAVSLHYSEFYTQNEDFYIKLMPIPVYISRIQIYHIISEKKNPYKVS
jgi:hypothetical protein